MHCSGYGVIDMFQSVNKLTSQKLTLCSNYWIINERKFKSKAPKNENEIWAKQLCIQVG